MSGQDDRLVRRAMDAAARRPAPGPCPDAEALGLYAERLLDADEQRAMDGHVAECARCQASLAAFVRGAPEAEVVDAADGVGVGARAGEREGGAPWWMGWKWLVPVAATAAVALVAVWVQRPAAPELTMSSAEPMETAPAASAVAPAQPGAAAPTAARGAAELADPGARAEDLAPPPTPRSAVSPPVGASTEAAFAEQRQASAERQRAAVTAGAGPESAAKPAAEQLAAAAPAAPPPPAPAAAPPAPAAMADAANATPRAKALSRAEAAAPADAAASGVAGRAEAAPSRAARQMATLVGRVTYRVRRALPAGAVVDVRLLDVSRADAPADVIGRVEIVTRGEQVPVPFALPYDASRIEPRRRYTVQVTITVDGTVAFRTTTAHTVLTGGAPSTNVEIVVEPMR